jgi:transposase, IS5 family
MGSKRQRGLFDFEDRMREIGEKDPLARLHEVVDWEAFRTPIEKAVVPEPKGPGGRPRFDAIIMLKVLVLQRLYHLSDAQTEFMIRDRLSFMRFVGVDLHEPIPDEKTIWRFKEELIAGRVMDQLWKAFDGELKRLGVQTSRGRILDASIVESTSKPRKKPDDEETEETTEEQNPHRERQIDGEARSTMKRKRWYFGYKNHIKIDAMTKLIMTDAVTDAAVHDRKMLPVLLSDDDKDCDVYADKGYAGVGPKSEVIAVEATPRIMHKGKRNKPVTTEQKTENKQWAKIRSRVEHVFGDQHTGMHLTKIRTRRKTRAEFTIRLNNLAYNLRRLGFLLQQPGFVTG